MTKILIGDILKCPANEEIYQRTIILDGIPTTLYSKDKSELELEKIEIKDKHDWSWDCNNEDFYCIKCGKPV